MAAIQDYRYWPRSRKYAIVRTGITTGDGRESGYRPRATESASLERGNSVRIKRALFACTTALLLTAGASLAGGTAFAATHTAGVDTTSGTRCSSAYFDDNSLLGPRTLPTQGLISPIVRGYRRLDGMTPGRFLKKYWDPTANGGKGSWRYPPDNGFLIADGHPVEFSSTLLRGEDVDRFGSEHGGFLAPADTPYANRSIPPQSLDNFDPASPAITISTVC